MRFKLLSVICAAALMTSACGAASSGGAMAKDQPGNGKWHNSGIAGSVSESEEIRLQDDFAAAVNKDFIVNAKAGDGTITEVTLSVLDKKKKLMDSLPDEKDANELKKFVDLATDWEARDKAGAEPLRKYLEAIEAISSLEDLTASLTELAKVREEFAVDKINKVITHKCVGCVVFSVFGAGHGPVVPAVAFGYYGLVGLVLQFCFYLFGFLQIVQVFEEQNPRGLLYVIKFAGAAFVGTQAVVQVFYCLLESHMLIFAYNSPKTSKFNEFSSKIR